jgi:hypothetical protein
MVITNNYTIEINAKKLLKELNNRELKDDTKFVAFSNDNIIYLRESPSDTDILPQSMWDSVIDSEGNYIIYNPFRNEYYKYIKLMNIKDCCEYCKNIIE